MTNYVGFINAMLELRDQRLRQSLAESEQQQQALSSLGKNVAGMFGSLGKMQETNKQDAMANSLMNQEAAAGTFGPPIKRAEAVNPAMQKVGDMMQNQTPGFYRGGMDELKMRMDMGDQRSKQLSRVVRAQQAQERINNTKERNIRADADKWANKLDKTDTANYNASVAYTKNRRIFEKDLAAADTPEKYQAASDQLTGLHAMAKKRGLDVPDLNISPYMSKEDKKALTDQQDAVALAQKKLQSAQGAPLGMMDKLRGMVGWTGPQQTIDKDAVVKSAQDAYNQAQTALRQMPGGAPRATPVTPPATTAATTGTITQPSGGVQLGDTRRNKVTGELQEWDGSRWVSVR